MRAFGYVATFGTLYERGKAIAVLEENNLMTGIEGSCHLYDKQSGEMTFQMFLATFLGKVNDMELRERGFAVTLRQLSITVLMLHGVGERLDRRRGRTEKRFGVCDVRKIDSKVACVEIWYMVRLLV